jgi:hypothetical protein
MIEPQIDTIPLFRIHHDGDAVLPVGGGSLGFRAAISRDASCGDLSDVDGNYAGYAWMSGAYRGFYIQTGAYFTSLADVLHDLTPLSPQLFGGWPEGVAFSPEATLATDGVFGKFNACADAITRNWSQQPFAAISVGADDGTSVKPADEGDAGTGNTNQSWKTSVSPRFGGVWYSYAGGEVDRVVVKPKPYAAPADFSVDVRAVGMPLCRYEALPWKLTRNGSQFTLPDWAREQMDAENYGPIHHCGPAIWGDKFTIYYHSKPIEQLYVANSRTPDEHSGEAPNQALRLASYAGVTVLPKYAVSKLWPGDPSRTIVAWALPEKNAGGTDNEDAQEFALELLVMKTDSGEVLQRYHEDSAFASDAMMFDGIALDTANYAVKPGARAFGLRASYSHSGYTSSEMTTLQLFLPEGRRLEPLAKSFVESFDSSDRGTSCDSNGSQMQRTVEVGATRSHGHADLVVHETSTETIAEDCKKASSAPQTTRRVLRFDGREYPVPGDWVE